MNDIKRTDIKMIGRDKWKFDFRENGYTIVSSLTTVKKGNKEEIAWRVGLHGTCLESCLKYIQSVYNGKLAPIDYATLKDTE